jgi:[ribosomal protein S18]-alanine N-acetyltransferase
MAVTLAAAGIDDLDAVDEISRHSFRAPWPRQTFVDELTRPHGRLWVARDPRVVGYLNYWLVADEVHLLAIAVHPDLRRRGVAAMLMAHLVDAARTARLITLEVRASNHGAVALYRQFGFAVAATRAGYYGGDGEDALVMLRPYA